MSSFVVVAGLVGFLGLFLGTFRVNWAARRDQLCCGQQFTRLREVRSWR